MAQYKEDVIYTYRNIISAEIEYNNWKRTPIVYQGEDLLNTTSQIMEVALSASILRSYNNTYNLSNDTRAYESVGAHTNLVLTILDRALFYEYGSNFKKTPEGFTYREIMEAARRHDLPENLIGDIPDNGTRNDAEKAVIEHSYLSGFSKLSPKRERSFEENVAKILQGMEDKSSAIGRSIYMADKVSAIIMTLVEDSRGISPMMSHDSPHASQNDLKNMEICDYGDEKSGCKASEMWTVAFFKTRNMVQYDDSGFYTALIVLATLIVNGKWYNWREKDYKEPPSKRG